MDVSFISTLIHGCKSIAPTESQTRKSMEQLIEDRNLKDHSNENEDEEELYLMGLLSLCNLRSFIRVVDKFETKIEDEKRLLFRSTYMPKIEELKGKLDEERILLIQRGKTIDSDINRILESENISKAWLDVSEIYLKRYAVEKNSEYYDEFIIRSSDVGIVNAHSMAAYYFFFAKKDYVEGEKRLFLLYNSCNKLTIGDAKSIMDIVNEYLLRGNTLTEGMNRIMSGLIEQGHPITKRNDGFYELAKKSRL